MYIHSLAAYSVQCPHINWRKFKDNKLELCCEPALVWAGNLTICAGED